VGVYSLCGGGPVSVGVKLLGVEADGKVREGRGDVLAAYLEDDSQLPPLLEKNGDAWRPSFAAGGRRLAASPKTPG